MSWITPDDLRTFVSNQKPGDDPLLTIAADVACGKVENLCGPIAWTAIVGERVEVQGATEVCLQYRVTRGLTDVSAYYPANPYTLTDWVAEGQVLKLKARTPIYTDLSVSYLTGYFDATDTAAIAPAWARSMALHIGQQWLKTVGKFRSSASTDPVGFLVPFPALEAGRDYLLAPRVG